jgi:hypothetical protein
MFALRTGSSVHFIAKFGLSLGEVDASVLE